MESTSEIELAPINCFFICNTLYVCPLRMSIKVKDGYFSFGYWKLNWNYLHLPITHIPTCLHSSRSHMPSWSSSARSSLPKDLLLGALGIAQESEWFLRTNLLKLVLDNELIGPQEKNTEMLSPLEPCHTIPPLLPPQLSTLTNRMAPVS